MNYKDLIKSVMSESKDKSQFIDNNLSFKNNFIPTDKKVIIHKDGSVKYPDIDKDEIPQDSGSLLPVQQYDSPYVNGSDIEFHPEQAGVFSAFQDLLREITGLEIGRYLSSSDGLRSLVSEINKYIGTIKSTINPEKADLNQYKFDYRNFNKQTDLPRAEINQKIASQILDTINSSSGDEKNLYKISALEEIKSLILNYLKNNLEYDTTATNKRSQNIINNSFVSFYNEFIKKFNVIKFTEINSNNLDIEKIKDSIKVRQGTLDKDITRISIVFKGNEDKDKAKFAYDVFSQDYRIGIDLYEERKILTLKNITSDEYKKDNTIKQDNIDSKAEAKKLFLDYLDNKVVLDEKIITLIEYYSLKGVLKILQKYFKNESDEYLDKIKNLQSINELEKNNLFREVEEFISEKLTILKMDSKLLESFMLEIKRGQNALLWDQ